jgi:hypothetical protein
MYACRQTPLEIHLIYFVYKEIYYILRHMHNFYFIFHKMPFISEFYLFFCWKNTHIFHKPYTTI